MINIRQEILLADLTTFKVGGLAKYFVSVKSETEVFEALEYAKKNELQIFILGGGSNVVVSDEGFDGLAVRMENSKMFFSENILSCEAGANLFEVVRNSASNGLTGFEWAAGIPGSFGGAIRGNAGAFGGEMKDNIKNVRAINIESGEIKEFSNEECEFSYRSSFFKKNPKWIILSAEMILEKGEKEKSEETVKDILKKRMEKQPQGFSSAGSFFQNPVVNSPDLIGKFEKDIGAKSRDGRVSAGWLIDEVGLRGKAVGGAMISKKHANFLINTGNAKADDIAVLSSIVKRKVRDELGVQLMEEIQYVGF